MLMNFEDDDPTGRPTPLTKPLCYDQPQGPPMARTPGSKSEQKKRHLLKVEADWGSPELHDYVVDHIDPGAEQGPNDHFIFHNFVKRWGDKAVPIAKFAFEVSDGKWHGKVVAPHMFQKGYDPYFAAEIVRILETR